MHFDDRFTDKAKRALYAAHEHAAARGHGYVGSEHILLALLSAPGAAERALTAAGVTRTFAEQAVERQMGRGEGGSTTVQGLTPRARHVIEIAAAAAEGRGSIGTEQLLMGILRERGSAASRIILSAGADPDRLYAEMADALPAGRTQTPERAPHPETRTLDQYARDMTAAAAKGLLDPVVGREKEIERVVGILSRRTKNNPVLIGEPGVGKTAVAEGLAQVMVAAEAPAALAGKRLVALDMSGMVAGTKYRGDFEERVRTVLADVRRAGDVILFIDELHTIIGAGAAEGAIDASNILKPALSRGELQVVGATTLEEYRKHIEKDAALERRFQPVTVEEPTPAAAAAILAGLRDRYEAHHRLRISDEAVEAAVTLGARYLPDRRLPDKAIDLIDEAAARVRLDKARPDPALRALEEDVKKLTDELEAAVFNRDFERAAAVRDREREAQAALDARRRTLCGQGGRQVTAEDVAAVVSLWTGIPVTALSRTESQRLLALDEALRRRVVGQDEAVAAVTRAIRRGRVGLKDPRRPMGSFLFLGPSGVGKTALCRALAEAVFGDENALIRLDMSEYMEKHAASRLLGSPPGYVGHDEGGQLTEKVRRRPYAVVLFDELEKADPDITNILLQIMEDGALTDARGRRVDFRNTIVIMTSNVGAEKPGGGRSVGFLPDGADGRRGRQDALAALKRAFRPEFLDRIDETVVFAPLREKELALIAELMLRGTAERLAARGVTLTWPAEAAALLAAETAKENQGARPMRRAVQTRVEDPLAEALLEGRLAAGDTAHLAVEAGTLRIEKSE